MNTLTIPELINTVEEQVILPDLQQEIIQLIKNKRRWNFVRVLTETTSQICGAIATILSFSSGIYKYDILSFLAGSINILSLLLLLFSNYSEKQVKKALDELEQIPVIGHLTNRALHRSAR